MNKRGREKAGSSHVPRQAGAYAVEFALVFVLFFVVGYAILTYALIFTAQHMLNTAAEDAARIALRWQANSNLSAKQLADMRQVVNTRTSWLASVRGAPIDMILCAGQGVHPASGSATANAGQLCAAAFPASGTTSNSVGVVLRYPYKETPLLPLLGPSFLVGAMVPDTLSAASAVTSYGDMAAVATGGGE